MATKNSTPLVSHVLVEGTDRTLELERYRDPLVRYFLRRGIPSTLAEDLAQECFVRLLALKDRSFILNSEAYLFRTAASVLTDHLRYSKSRRASQHVSIDLVSPPAEMLTPERALEGGQALSLLLEALAELKPRTSEIFLLNRLEGLTYTQIAVRFRISPSAIETHMATALAHLHERLRGL